MITIIRSSKKNTIDYYLKCLDINCKYYYNANGKPFLNNLNYFVSKTNKNNIDIFAISDENIGIDIEIKDNFPLSLDEIVSYFKINIFYSSEVNNFEHIPCKIWTILEAYTKLEGLRLIDIAKRKNFITFKSDTYGYVNDAKFICLLFDKYILTLVQK